MKLLNTETPVTRNFIPQILLNVQGFYFHKVGYASYDEGSSDLRAYLSFVPLGVRMVAYLQGILFLRVLETSYKKDISY
jgi:hypothetical protein